MRTWLTLLGLTLLTGCASCESCEGCGPAAPGLLDAGPPVVVDAGLAPAPTDAGLVDDAARRVVIRQTVGEVVIGRAGGWRPASEGGRVEESESVRTRAGGRATVTLGEGNELELGQDTEVTITSIDDQRARVRLERGRMGADLSGKTLLQVEGAGSGTVAEARKGRMSVYTNGRGLVAVAAESAQVELHSASGKTVLAAGEQAVVRGEAAPEVVAIPKEVFLNVAWPEQRATRKKKLELLGRVEPGSDVRVNGRLANIDEKGRFRIQVPLREGRNTLKVVAEDPLGREVRRTQTVDVRRQAPDVTAETDALWK